MKIKIPRKIRALLYIITAVGSPIMVYLLALGVVNDAAMVLWGAEVAVVAALAGFNLSDE